jgi:peptidoglycan/LPS O-acetylase OafA/YrhL
MFAFKSMAKHLSPYRSSIAADGSRSISETINSQDNNYTLIRIFLSMSVIYYHSFGMVHNNVATDRIDALLSSVDSLGALAVQIFFFLSGLFVTQSYFKNPSVPRFLIKRFFRIWPGLFVCVIVTAIAACLTSDPKHILGYFYLPDFYQYIINNAKLDIAYDIPGIFLNHQFSGINGSIHTLPLEAAMYAILAVLAGLKFFSTKKRIALTSIVLLAIASSSGVAWTGVGGMSEDTFVHRAAAMFCAGVVTFAWADRIRLRVWHVVGLSILVALTHGAIHVVAFYLAVIVWTLYLGESKAIGKLLRPRNDLSYGIYIYGWPSQQLVLDLTKQGLNPYLLTTGALTLSFAFALVSWRFVEKPSIRLGHFFAEATPALWRLPDIKRLMATYETRLGIGLGSLLIACVATQWATETFDFAPVSEMQTHIIDFGPREGKAGLPLDGQPDGESAIWLKLDSTPAAGTSIVMAGTRLKTSIASNVATAVVDNKLIRHAGNKSLYLEARSAGQITRSNIENLRIVP